MHLDRVFRALGDPTRRAVLSRLSAGSAAVSELARSFDMALPSFTQHLDVLEQSGLVRSRKVGRVRTYRLVPQPLKAAERWMAQQRALWERRLDQLDKYLMELKAALEDDDDRRPVLLDLCLPRDLPRRTDMLAGASMHAPAALPSWIKELPRDRPIAVYCICGFQVSGTAVTELRNRGYDARALVGGITAWHAIGGSTVPLDTSTYEQARQ